MRNLFANRLLISVEVGVVVLEGFELMDDTLDVEGVEELTGGVGDGPVGDEDPLGGADKWAFRMGDVSWFGAP